MLLVETRLAPSPIGGIGLFADAPISRGQHVWRFTPGLDLVVPARLVRGLPEPAKTQFLRYSYLESTTNQYVLCFDDARFFNHSDEPNTESRSAPAGQEFDVANRDIATGEELTCDYRDFDLEWETKLWRSSRSQIFA